MAKIRYATKKDGSTTAKDGVTTSLNTRTGETTKIGGTNTNLNSAIGRASKASGTDFSGVRNFSELGAAIAGLNSNKDNFISSSKSERGDEFSLASDIKNITEQNPVFSNVFDINATVDNLKNIYDSSNELLDSRLEQLRQRGKDQMSSINDSFDIAAQKLEDQQTRSKGTFSVGLANIGGYLGQSASGMGAIRNLEQEFAFERADLEAKRAAAIQAANDALNDSEFELASQALQNAREFEKSMQTATQNFFDNTLSLSREIRQDTESKRDFAIEQTERLIDFSIESGEDIAPEDILAASDVLGIEPTIIQGAIKAKRNTKALELAKDRTAMDIQLIGALSKIPKGTYVTIGGKTYEGMDSGDGKIPEVSYRVQLQEDIRSGEFDRKQLLDLYGPYLGVNDVVETIEATEDADVDVKLATGQYGSIEEKNVEIIYDQEAYDQAIQDWKDEGGGRGLFPLGKPKKEDYEITRYSLK